MRHTKSSHFPGPGPGRPEIFQILAWRGIWHTGYMEYLLAYWVYGVPKILTFAKPGRPEISSLMSLRGPHHATYKAITFPKPWAWAARNLSNPWRGIWHTGYMGHWVSRVHKILTFAKPGRPEISSLISVRGPHHATYKVLTFLKP